MKRKKIARKVRRPAAKRGSRRRIAKPVRRKRPRRGARKPPPQADLEREIRRLRAARAKLERRLTAAVQEIGMLRQFELRATMLEGELERLRRESEERIRESSSAGVAAAPLS